MIFDEHGYLTPYELIPTDLSIMEAGFVKPFYNSKTRGEVFDAFINYLTEVESGLNVPLEIRVSGSFKKVAYKYWFRNMSQIVASDDEQRVLRLLELIDARRAMLKKHREAVEPSQLMIDEYEDLLRRHVNERNLLMQVHGLSVQLTQALAA